MVEGCSIRPAARLEELTELWQDVYRRQHVPLLPAKTNIPFHPCGDGYVATVGDASAGFCCVDGACLTELWVAIRWQRRGVGRALVSHAEALMRQNGEREATLTVLALNAAAIAFYERLGWHRDSGTLCSVTGLPYLRYRKRLDAYDDVAQRLSC